jgi:hypothetical protein
MSSSCRRSGPFTLLLTNLKSSSAVTRGSQYKGLSQCPRQTRRGPASSPSRFYGSDRLSGEYYRLVRCAGERSCEPKILPLELGDILRRLCLQYTTRWSRRRGREILPRPDVSLQNRFQWLHHLQPRKTPSLSQPALNGSDDQMSVAVEHIFI